MTITTRALMNIIPRGIGQRSGSSLSSGGLLSSPQSFEQFARRGFAGNPVLFAGLSLIATSAAEPHIIGRRYRRNRRRSASRNQGSAWDTRTITLREAQGQAAKEERWLRARGIPNKAGAKMVDSLLVRNNYWEQVDDHPLVRLLNNPNQFSSRGQMWGMATLDYHLAGNAYMLKARYTQGLLEGAVAELWRLRPDRVKVVPSETEFIAGYEYGVGRDTVFYPARDVMHFKTPNPLDAYYGMPPLLSIARRLGIAASMDEFLWEFYSGNGIGPMALITTKNRMPKDERDRAEERFRSRFGPGHRTDWLLLDNAEGLQFTPLTLNRGLRDALPAEINAQTEADLSMVLGVPGSILGALIGYESSSYANKRQDWQVLWDVKMTPMLSDFDDVLNLSMVPEYNGTIDEVEFDLSDIRALQEDEDKLEERHRKNFQVGGIGIKEFRLRIGEDPELPEDDVFLIPSSSVATKAGEIGEPVAPPAAPAQLMAQAVQMMLPAPAWPALPEPDMTRVGRARREDDEEARGIWSEALAMRTRHPGVTMAQIARRVGVSERTLFRYQETFGDDE